MEKMETWKHEYPPEKLVYSCFLILDTKQDICMTNPKYE